MHKAKLVSPPQCAYPVLVAYLFQKLLYSDSKRWSFTFDNYSMLTRLDMHLCPAVSVTNTFDFAYANLKFVVELKKGKRKGLVVFPKTGIGSFLGFAD